MKAIQFLRSVHFELKHVKWPSRARTILFTIVVAVVSLAVGYLLGGFDALFQLILKKALF